MLQAIQTPGEEIEIYGWREVLVVHSRKVGTSLRRDRFDSSLVLLLLLSTPPLGLLFGDCLFPVDNDEADDGGSGSCCLAGALRIEALFDLGSGSRSKPSSKSILFLG